MWSRAMRPPFLGRKKLPPTEMVKVEMAGCLLVKFVGLLFVMFLYVFVVLFLFFGGPFGRF